MPISFIFSYLQSFSVVFYLSLYFVLAQDASACDPHNEIRRQGPTWLNPFANLYFNQVLPSHTPPHPCFLSSINCDIGVELSTSTDSNRISYRHKCVYCVSIKAFSSLLSFSFLQFSVCFTTSVIQILHSLPLFNSQLLQRSPQLAFCPHRASNLSHSYSRHSLSPPTSQPACSGKQSISISKNEPISKNESIKEAL